MRAAVCVPFSPATLLHLGSIPNNPRRVSIPVQHALLSCSTSDGTCHPRGQRQRRPQQASTQRSWGWRGTQQRSLLLWMHWHTRGRAQRGPLHPTVERSFGVGEQLHSTCRRHTPPSQQPPSTHEFSFVECTPTSWRLRCKAEPTRLSVRTRCSPHFYARLGDPRSHGQQCMVSHLTHSIPSVRDNFHYIVLCLLSPHRRWRGQLLSWWSWRPV
jgi:hypothetical protein